MREFDLETLMSILREAAGQDESVDLTAGVLDVPFTELGYDSLALLETSGKLARDYGVKLADEDIEAMDTPRAMVDKVNAVLAAAR